MFKNTNEPQRHVEFEFARGNMKKACKGDLTWLNKTSIEVLEDGRLFTENDGLVEIYSNGFCIDTIISNAFRTVSAIKCQHVKPSKNCTRKRDVPQQYVQSNSSCSREKLDLKFRIVYSVLGGFSLVSIFYIQSNLDLPKYISII